ncbi:GNAT family N-acetyltransferase [Modestobacter sp. SYSU DS0290]
MTVAEIRTLLARAHADDPLLAWVFPDARDRPEAAAAWLGVSAERYVAAGQVDLVRDGALSAVALWRRPWTTLAGAPDLLPTAGGLLRAFVGAARAAEIAEGFAAARAQTADDVPCAYLHFLAVAPDAQGRGLGGRLLDGVLDRAAEDGVPLRLDTTNPANLPFYEAHGLRVRSEVRLGPTGPVMWGMESTPV